MTGKSLARLVRAIAYRRRLMEDLSDLEAELRAFLQSEGLTQLTVGGYKVKLTGGDMTFSETEAKTNINQLEFDFERDFEATRSGQIERQTTGS